MKLYPLFFLLAGLLFFSACGDGRKDIRDYYFPFRQLTDGLVYEYTLVGEQNVVPDYWYYRSFLSDTAQYLTATYYDENLLPAQLSRQELVSNGVLAVDLKLYTPDTLGKHNTTQADIVAGAVYPFRVKKDEGLVLYKATYQLPDDNGPTTLVLNRQYAGDTTFLFQDITYPAVHFRLTGVAEIEDDKAGGIEPRFSGEEIYAKGIGLVYYSRIFNNITIAYTLHDRYGMEKLEARFQNTQQVE